MSQCLEAHWPVLVVFLIAFVVAEVIGAFLLAMWGVSYTEKMDEREADRRRKHWNEDEL